MRQFQIDHRKGGVGLLFFQTDRDLAIMEMTIQNRLWVIGQQYQRVIAKLESDKGLPDKLELNDKCQKLVDESSADLKTLRTTYDPAFEDPETCNEQEMEYNWLMQCCYGKIFTAALITGMLERNITDDIIEVE